MTSEEIIKKIDMIEYLVEALSAGTELTAAANELKAYSRSLKEPLAEAILEERRARTT